VSHCGPAALVGRGCQVFRRGKLIIINNTNQKLRQGRWCFLHRYLVVVVVGVVVVVVVARGGGGGSSLKRGEVGWGWRWEREEGCEER